MSFNMIVVLLVLITVKSEASGLNRRLVSLSTASLTKWVSVNMCETKLC